MERERELEGLEAAVADAVDGRGRVVVIEGPAGIGKSALMDEARRRAAGSVRLLGARGGLLERDFTFGIVRQLLEAVTYGRAMPDAAQAVFGDPVPDTRGDGDGEGPAPDRGYAALHGLFWTVLDLAHERPLLLAVDDLQWADRSSLRFFAYLARRIEELPVLLLATVRTGEPDVDEDLLRAVREPPALLITPPPLTREGVRAVVAERLGREADDAFAAACHTATGGNPLLVRELAGALAADGVAPDARQARAVQALGPRAVSRTVGVRLARLPADAVAVAQAVAVLGDGVAVADAARFAGLDETRVAAATGPLAAGDILRPDPPLAFVHPLVADAVLLTLSPGERELRHEQAAHMLRDMGAPAEQIAGHLLRAPGRGEAWVVDVLRAAAQGALRRGSAEGGTAFLRRALEEPPPADLRAALLLEVGLAEAMTSGAQAVEHLRGALAALVDPAQRSLAAGALGRALLFTGEALAGSQVAERVAAELGPEHADLRDQLRAFGHQTKWFDERSREAVVTTPGILDAPPGPGATTGERMLAAVQSFGLANIPSARETCAAFAHAALEGGHVNRQDAGLMAIPPAVALVYAEDPAGLAYLEEWLADALEQGSLYAVAGLRLWLAAALLWEGELIEAEDAARQAITDLTVWGFDHGPDYAGAYLSGALTARGRLAEAETVLSGTRRGGIFAEGGRALEEARLTLLVAQGRDEEALALADVLERDAGTIRTPVSATWRLARAVVRHRTGDPDGALQDLAEHLRLAQTWGAPGPIGRALRVRGELTGTLTDLEEAVGLLAGSRNRLEHARALVALGRQLRLERRPTEAREPLREGLALAARIGADALAADARTELGAAGARPRTDALRGPESLTPSERRIAVLAASGRTNRDIAQELYVTPKTIEVHLSAAYRKLGIASRRGLPEALGTSA